MFSHSQNIRNERLYSISLFLIIENLNFVYQLNKSMIEAVRDHSWRLSHCTKMVYSRNKVVLLFSLVKVLHSDSIMRTDKARGADSYIAASCPLQSGAASVRWDTMTAASWESSTTYTDRKTTTVRFMSIKYEIQQWNSPTSFSVCAHWRFQVYILDHEWLQICCDVHVINWDLRWARETFLKHTLLWCPRSSTHCWPNCEYQQQTASSEQPWCQNKMKQKLSGGKEHWLTGQIRQLLEDCAVVNYGDKCIQH